MQREGVHPVAHCLGRRIDFFTRRGGDGPPGSAADRVGFLGREDLGVEVGFAREHAVLQREGGDGVGGIVPGLSVEGETGQGLVRAGNPGQGSIQRAAPGHPVAQPRRQHHHRRHRPGKKPPLRAGGSEGFHGSLLFES